MQRFVHLLCKWNLNCLNLDLFFLLQAAHLKSLRSTPNLFKVFFNSDRLDANVRLSLATVDSLVPTANNRSNKIIFSSLLLLQNISLFLYLYLANKFLLKDLLNSTKTGLKRSLMKFSLILERYEHPYVSPLYFL